MSNVFPVGCGSLPAVSLYGYSESRGRFGPGTQDRETVFLGRGRGKEQGVEGEDVHPKT